MWDRDGDGITDPVPEDWRGGGGWGCLVALLIIGGIVIFVVQP